MESARQRREWSAAQRWQTERVKQTHTESLTFSAAEKLESWST